MSTRYLLNLDNEVVQSMLKDLRWDTSNAFTFSREYLMRHPSGKECLIVFDIHLLGGETVDGLNVNVVSMHGMRYEDTLNIYSSPVYKWTWEFLNEFEFFEVSGAKKGSLVETNYSLELRLAKVPEGYTPEKFLWEAVVTLVKSLEKMRW